MKNALKELVDLEKDANRYGFRWPTYDMAISQAVDECKEIKEAIDLNEPLHRIQEEVGDLLHAAISLCILCDFDVEDTLDKINHKFEGRMQALKELTQEQGLNNLEGQSVEFMLDLWKKAKSKNLTQKH